MATIYNVIFEECKGDIKIAAVTNNRRDKDIIAGSISSKGIDHRAIIIEYSCNTALHNDFYVVYTREFTDTDNVKGDGKFHKLFIEYGQEYPTTDDLYLYKLEKSALDRVDKINDSFTRSELKTKKAEILHCQINTIY